MFVRFIRNWLPVLLWMALIFAGSTNLGAPRNTSRILGPLLHWIMPDISEETRNAIVFGIRKCAHATEYSILSLLVWRSRRQSQTAPAKEWRWPDARFAIVLSALYAMTDELHQTFVRMVVNGQLVSSRQGSPWDVLIDTGGATFAMLFLWLVFRWRNRTA